MNIKYIPGRKSPWCIDYTANGKRKRKFCETKAEAKARLMKLQNERDRLGTEALTFDPRERADYAECKRLLAQFGIGGLVSAFVSRAIQKPENRIVKQDFLIAFDEFFASKQKLKRRHATLETLLRYVRPFCEYFASRITIDELTKSDIEQYTVRPKWSPRTCRNAFTNILSFLNFCHTRDWLSFSPVFNKKSILPKELQKPIATFSVPEIESFFRTLENSRYKDLCGFFAVQAFCGLRNAEAGKISIEEVDFEARTITLTCDITKTGDTWTMRDLPENLWAWLESYPRIICPTECRTNALKKLWGGTWKPNRLRHTFATMHVSLFQNPAKTSLILRHRNQQRLWQNYLANPVSAEDAKRYFSILPKKSLD